MKKDIRREKNYFENIQGLRALAIILVFAYHLDYPFLIIIWHLLVGYLLTISCDWNWIPLTKEEKKRGPSLDQIRGKLFG